MLTRLSNYLKFQIERFILRGTLFRLLFIAILIVLVSFVGGLLAVAATSGFQNVWEAVWWAFLRLTDPGYLGDDQGSIKRAVSTVLTVLGYVLFMGALIAIMTQWLHETIAKLQRGLTPIVLKNHVLILGWSDRTPVIVGQLLHSRGRMKRFLHRLGEDDLHIVILAEEIGPHLVQDLKDSLGPKFSRGQITLRSGEPLYAEHLERVDYRRAGVILLPAEFGPAESGLDSASDSRVIKALLTASDEHDPQELPLMVAEVNDIRNRPIAIRAYGGPIEILPVGQILARLMAQNVRHRGLSEVFAELFNQQAGSQIYIRACPDLTGQTFGQVRDNFPQAIVLGITDTSQATHRTIFNPPLNLTLTESHRYIFLARRFEDCQPDLSGPPPAAPHPVAPSPAAAAPSLPPSTRLRILVLGWNQHAQLLIKEFDNYENESFDIVTMSMVPESRRQAMTERHDAIPQRVNMRHLLADYTSMSDLQKVNPASFDHIVLLASDRMESDAESEARAVHGYLVLQEVLANTPHRPSILVELMTPENVGLFESRGDEVIVRPQVLSHILTQVAMRRELQGVYEELFGAGGADIQFRPAADYADPGAALTFRQVQHQSQAHGEVALGFRLRGQRKDKQARVKLNPEKDLSWRMTAEDQVIVIAGL